MSSYQLSYFVLTSLYSEEETMASVKKIMLRTRHFGSFLDFTHTLIIFESNRRIQTESTFRSHLIPASCGTHCCSAEMCAHNQNEIIFGCPVLLWLISPTMPHAKFYSKWSTFCSISVLGQQFATKFCTYHDSIAVVTHAKLCGDYCLRLRSKWNDIVIKFELR